MEPLLRRMWRAATVGATTIVARPTIELQEEGSQCSTHIVCYRSPVQKQEEGFEPVGVRSWANARAFAAQHARREGAAALPARSAGDIPPYPSVCLCARCVKGLRRGDRLQTTYRQGFPRRSWHRAGRWRTFPWPGRLPCRRALGFRPLPQTCGA